MSFFLQKAFASTSLSISDAVYADLALRHDLDSVSIDYANGIHNQNVTLNETRHWLPASTVKTFAAMYAYKLISQGEIHLSDVVTIDVKNAVSTELVTDELPTFIEGETVTISHLIRQMIIQSDNTAFNQLLDVIGRDRVTTYIQSLGLIHSHVGSKLNLDDSQTQYEYDVPGYGINTTTAQDYALAFQLIKNNKISGAKDLFTVLKAQKINTMIPLYLPKDVVCAHKTGDLAPLYHDGGICQDKKQSYILTIFTNANDPFLLAHLSELIYTKNYDLVGKTLEEKQIGEREKNPPIDELVLNPPAASVLGVSTANNFPVPEVTAADLGVSVNDLSPVLKDSQLPKVFIPFDSPFHFLSDDWVLFKHIVTLNSQDRRIADLETAKLRIAETKDLLNRGKITQASALSQTIQQGLTAVAKEQNLAQDATAQNTIQSVSETRFAVLGDAIQNAKGDEKLALIKQVADQAKATAQSIDPNIPDAKNASSPSQKPLIGTVIATTDASVTVKTAGGQQVVIPVTHTNILVKDEAISTTAPSPTSFSQTPVISQTVTPPLTQTLSFGSLAVGTTVALLGSASNNTFVPRLILANIPRELAAPQPVTVAKVDLKHNTMVVVENGVYTQVNVNKKTEIKATDTNIPLKEIHLGDIVVVHGEPLTEVNPVPTQTLSPSQTPQITPTSIHAPVSFSVGNVTNTVSPTHTPSVSSHVSPLPLHVIQSTSIQVIEKKQDAENLPHAASSQQPSQPGSSPKPAEQKSASPQPNPPEQKSQPVVQAAQPTKQESSSDNKKK